MENISGELKRQQTLLEDNITRLKKSLEYWQTWEVEYEGLKEEVQKLGDQYINAELVRNFHCSHDILVFQEMTHIGGSWQYVWG